MTEYANHREETFFLNNFNIDRVFHAIERADYLFLYYIKRCEEQEPQQKIVQIHSKQGKRVYLSALADAMNMEIPELSKAVENLQGKGYVSWKTDSEAGKTYVELTSKAVELMNDERRRMENSYRQIQEEIGAEELERTVRTMGRIAAILKRADTGQETTE